MCPKRKKVFSTVCSRRLNAGGVETLPHIPLNHIKQIILEFIALHNRSKMVRRRRLKELPHFHELD